MIVNAFRQQLGRYLERVDAGCYIACDRFLSGRTRFLRHVASAADRGASAQFGQLGTRFAGLRDELRVSYESLSDNAVSACAEDLEHVLVTLCYTA